VNPHFSGRLRPCLFVFGLCAAVGARGAGTTAAPELTVTGLRCEAAPDPRGVDLPAPRLSWQAASAARGAREVAWQILVASSEAGLAVDQGDLWDSGRRPADDSTPRAYAGSALASWQSVFWKVRAWDEQGQPSAWSAPAHWTMGLLRPEDWRGGWIAAPGETESLLLRREFVVGPGLRRALAAVSGLGQYELSCNGRKAGEDLLSPGWTDYERTTLYELVDLTGLLRTGRNALGLMLGNGMYDVVHRDRYAKFNGFSGPLRAILQLRLEYEDGRVEWIGTDPNWRTAAGPITFGNAYGGEDYDARLLPAGWDQPDFDDRRWAPAVGYLKPPGVLRSLTAAADPIRAAQVFAPVATRRLPDGSVIYDFGQNAACMPRLRVTGPAGSSVRLTPAEVLNPDGTINRATMGGTGRGGSWWQYTKATDGPEEWMPRFCYIGCRYLKAECSPPAQPSDGTAPAGEPARIAGLENIAVHSTAPAVGHFAASNPLLGRIDQLVRWAQVSNMMSIFTDCPHREKLGWLEQLHLNGPALRFNFDAVRMFRKSMHDMADEEKADGFLPTTAPEYAKFQSPFLAAAEWGSAFIIVPWQQYEFSGDPSLLRENYDGMKRYVGYLRRQAADDILAEGLGDWYDLGPIRPGAAQLTPAPVTATAFYYFDATVLARTAALLGRTEEAAAFAAQAERIRGSFNRHFFHADTGSYASGSQCANAMALAMGLAEPADRPRVLAALVQDVESRGDAMTAGDVGYRYLLLALAQGGRSDLIYKMVNQDTQPGYGYILKQGATSLTEAWDANTHASQDHFMLGQITEWFYQNLAGIEGDPAGPGFRKIVFRPQPVGDLTWAEASYDSVRGPIKARWERSGEQFTLEVTVPAGSTATVYVPSWPATAVQEGPGPAEKSAGVTYLRREGDRSVFAVESGRYRFSSQW
jgi:hypothetical protein